ncbi:RrF2 family transcriptional regulator [Flavobacterium sp. RNTU_13]|uniref:RrF2 family transcriptional regulator n=1 Tax=Flavobacterium sp. RNTU_13 TaxID=3375145 RepID=UPI003985782F
MISGKFAITIHILTLMSRRPDEYLSSDYLAGCININPVLVRKEISNLKKHGIVACREGKFGGTRLARPAGEITLEDVYNSTVECVSLGFAKNDPNPECPVGCRINESLDNLYQNINNLICCELKGLTLENFSRQFAAQTV